MDIIERLSEHFARFPGIGERQARRFVYFILKSNNAYVKDFLESIVALKKNSMQCQSCFRFFEFKKDTPDNQKNKLCTLCTNPNTDQTLLMVVEKDSDIEPARAGGFEGKFFILGGLALFGKKSALEKTQYNELLIRIKKEAGKLQEIILAFSANPAGEYTDQVLRENLSLEAKKHGLKITSLGRGLSTGAELEYTDPDTLKSALKNRS